MSNLFSHPYQWDETIGNFRFVEVVFFIFRQISKETSIRKTRRLIWLCTVYRCPTKRTLGVYGLIQNSPRTVPFALILSLWRFAASDLVLHCWSMSDKKDARLNLG